ncbi:uncharacterized protein LOC106092148 [Stomoxys calcitrans]|uniref:Protein TsetseEP domain-containing protein n=1 Tax=Stomoxys calcitrans TaxID=35570 RepID=A0A1I8P633_STOCA|nr:uncharacterized protein LOC106092148 [Stomoxys calcitrans]
MKFTIVAVVVALCLAGANANAIGFQVPHPNEFEYVPNDFANDMEGIEDLTIFSSFYWIAKAALKTLKGVNCTIKQVMNTRSVTQNFIPSIQACGTDAVSAFTNVFTSAQSVITTCDNIINLNEQVCNNDVSTNGQTSTPSSCSTKLFGQLTTLYVQIQKTKAAIKKLPTVPSDAVACTNSAVTTLTTAFTNFPSNIKSCSKLTSS